MPLLTHITRRKGKQRFWGRKREDNSEKVSRERKSYEQSQYPRLTKEEKNRDRGGNHLQKSTRNGREVLKWAKGEHMFSSAAEWSLGVSFFNGRNEEKGRPARAGPLTFMERRKRGARRGHGRKKGE